MPFYSMSKDKIAVLVVNYCTSITTVNLPLRQWNDCSVVPANGVQRGNRVHSFFQTSSVKVMIQFRWSFLLHATHNRHARAHLSWPDVGCLLRVPWLMFCYHLKQYHVTLNYAKSQIAKTLRSMSMRYSSDETVSDHYLIDNDPSIFAIWVWESTVQS